MVLNPTIDGVVRAPSEFGMIFTSILPPALGADVSTTATHEFVVPRSIPITFPHGRLAPVLRQFVSLVPPAPADSDDPPPLGGLATTTIAARTRRSPER